MATLGEACSRIGAGPTIKEVFDRSKFVFKGTITKAELIDADALIPKSLLSKEDAEIIRDGGFVVVRVYWKVEKIYKGKLPKKGNAIAVASMCWPVLATVGIPYVFSVSEFDSSGNDAFEPGVADFYREIMKGSLGTLDADGTISMLQDSERFENFVTKLDELVKN